ncbi:phenoloxidase-activating factor 2-like [Bicyclus anynana]|nr:phenoloxidase-activating factor 2-like [Bicyclus anynana]XP_052745788.1 phenoloxidase-activating factor 2-like [Bicyclus anynana]
MALLVSCSAQRRFTVNPQTNTIPWRQQPMPQQKTGTSNGESCFTTDQQEGVCVKYTMCMDEPPKIDATRAFVYRSQDTSQCPFLQICCPRNRIRTTPVVPPINPTTGCGYSNIGAGVFRQTGTTASGRADFAEFPWMVALLKKTDGVWNDKDYIGGGTLISPSVVLTAAHKVDSLRPNQLKCRAGEWETQNENEYLPYQERDVDRINTHLEFARLDAHYDAALLFLVTPFTIQGHINLACLAPTLPPPGTVCYGMGWGKDFTNSQYNAHVLKKIPLPLVDKADCERMLRKTILGPQYTVHRTLTCAGGYADVDTCMGDGGAPLVCPIGDPSETRYMVVGMTAYGLDRCGIDGVPGVYVNVPKLYRWITSQVDVAQI